MKLSNLLFDGAVSWTHLFILSESRRDCVCELQLLENKLDGMDLGLTFSVDTDNFGAYEEIEVCLTSFFVPIVVIRLVALCHALLV